jgi:lipoprotein-releasing system permease protein
VQIPFELHIALRYLLAKRKQAFISVISSISALGVTVGVMSVVIALALMTGLQEELRDRIVGANPHIYVWKSSGIVDYRAEADRLRRVAHVVGAAPEILGLGLISAGSTTLPLQLKGVDPALEPQVTDIEGALESGRLEALASPAEGQRDGILLGADLAGRLGVAVGDLVQITTPEGTLTPMGMSPPRPRPLRVAGTFSLGLYEIDSMWGFVSLDVAGRLLNKDNVDLIQLRVDDIYRAPDVARTIESTLGAEYVTEDWARMNRSLFSALRLERIAIALAIGLIILVAALNIVASLVLLVMEKHRDIAILKTMGASAWSMMLIFVLQGLIIGVAGTTIGATAGAGLAVLADKYRWIRVSTDVYQVSHMPFRVEPLDVTFVVLAAVTICFLATIYPSRQAAQLDPAQALRYE